MYGNVAEWALTFNGSEAVLKGGSWHDRTGAAARAARRAYKTFQPVFDVGFRVLVEK